MELKNKVVVITGGTKGLGKALAFSFAKEKAQVVVCSKDEPELKEMSEEGILGIYADVTKESELQNVLEITKEKFGGVDIWINNAGIWLPHTRIEDTDWQKAHDLMEVNLFGTVYGSKIALIEMRKEGVGLIMNILSTRALYGKADCSAYCASKFAAKGFTETLREEAKGTNIKVISVYPEKIRTNLFYNKIPVDYDNYMDPVLASSEIIENIKKDNPSENLIVKRAD